MEGRKKIELVDIARYAFEDAPFITKVQFFKIWNSRCSQFPRIHDTIACDRVNCFFFDSDEAEVCCLIQSTSFPEI
ncbi:MAG: hypothetical protein LBD11_03840 [Candidatus Peribacteria bacterium]|nr:hypothetical protein [Candidatus Peribacteria bacterium]